jgi:hypothetical protein
MNCTLIISYQNDSPQRQSSFEINKSIALHSKIPLIVCEQIKSKKNKIVYEEKENFLHIKYFSNNLFEKSKLYNLAIAKCETEYLWFLDCDVIVNLKATLPYIKDSLIIRPFSKVFILGEIESDLFKNGFENSLTLEKYPFCQTFGKHSFIIHKSLLNNSTKFDENFVGWGWEDLDFVRSKLKNAKPRILENFQGIHLYHPDSNKLNRRSNYLKYIENIKLRYLFQCVFIIDEKKYKSINDILNFSKSLSRCGKDLCFLFYLTNPDIPLDEILKFKIESDQSVFIFVNKKNLSLGMHINNCIYLSQSKYFSIFEDLSTISHSKFYKFFDLFHGLNKPSIQKFDFTAFHRGTLNNFTGFKDSNKKSFTEQINDLHNKLKDKPTSHDPTTSIFWDSSKLYTLNKNHDLDKFSG